MVLGTALKHCDTKCQRFSYWILFKTDIVANKKQTNKIIRQHLTSLLGVEGVRWQFQGAGSNFILKLNEPRDYTFLLLKMSGD
jgi:hypothetical protein